MRTLKEIMTENPNVSIRRIAQIADVSYGGLLKASHKPVQGQVYDPNTLNFEAINQMLASKLPEDFDWETVLAQVEAPVQTPTEFKVGDSLRLRNPIGTKYTKETIYCVVYLTATHIVLLPEGSTEPRTLAINTMVQYGRPVEAGDPEQPCAAANVKEPVTEKESEKPTKKGIF